MFEREAIISETSIIALSTKKLYLKLSTDDSWNYLGIFLGKWYVMWETISSKNVLFLILYIISKK